jgi:hypothetical protein
VISLDILGEEQVERTNRTKLDEILATPPDSFGLEPNTKVIGIAGQRGKLKDGLSGPPYILQNPSQRNLRARRPLKA